MSANPLRVRKIFACVSGVLAIAPVPGHCVPRVVNTCDDNNSAGSLRTQILAANSGDTIDLSTPQLTCSTITLTQGQVAFSVQDLTLTGPADRTVTITTSTADRLLYHSVSGQLTIQFLTLSGGYLHSYGGDAKGGCIAAMGGVTLTNAVVSGCTAYTNSGAVARGGGIYATGEVYLDTSRVVGNTAYNVTNAADGGGVAAPVGLRAKNSTISANAANARGALPGRGGGVYSGTLLVVKGSTIDSNFAQEAGGIHHTAPSNLAINSIGNSTLSGNSAASSVGAISCRCATLEIYNSTIAFNAAPASGGLYASTTALVSTSTIIARNSAGSGFADVTLAGFSSWSGQNNLVASYSLAPPAGVVTVTADPQLTPLAFHGGPTRTHAPLATSPAIDAGADTFALPTDQRGGAYAREVPSGKPDIGAYERQVNDDEIFYSGFD